MQISYESIFGRQGGRQKVIMFTGHLNRKHHIYSLGGTHAERLHEWMNFMAIVCFLNLQVCEMLGRQRTPQKWLLWSLKRLIHTLHQLPCLILLLDGRWRLEQTSTYHFSFSDWLPPNSVWVNVSTLFCSSACLRAHRSRFMLALTWEKLQ